MVDVVDDVSCFTEVAMVEVVELEGTSFSVVDLVKVPEEVEEVALSVSELAFGVTVTCAVDEGTVTVTTPALPPVADPVSVEEERELVASPEGVTVVCVVEEGMVIVTTPPAFPPVADLASVVDEDVCWLAVFSVVGVTVTWTVEEGTVIVTAFPAPVWEVVELCTMEELTEVESPSSDAVWLGVVEVVTVDGKNPVTLNWPSFALLLPGVAVASAGVCEVELPDDTEASADPVATVPCACVLLCALVGPFTLRLLAVELEDVCEDVEEATMEDPAGCSVDPVAETVEDTVAWAKPDGPKELRATVSTTED